jgi:hypothetical protein
VQCQKIPELTLDPTRHSAGERLGIVARLGAWGDISRADWLKMMLRHFLALQTSHLKGIALLPPLIGEISSPLCTCGVHLWNKEKQAISNQLPSMRGLSALSSLARYGRHDPAAQALGISRSALSHRIADLEEELGVSLVVKRGRLSMITEEGLALLAAMGDAIEKIEAAVAPLQRRRRQLRLSTVSTFASNWLLPRLRDFQARHPDRPRGLDNAARSRFRSGRRGLRDPSRTWAMGRAAVDPPVSRNAGACGKARALYGKPHGMAQDQGTEPVP